MSFQVISIPERLKRFLYTSTYNGAFITGNPDNQFCKMSHHLLFVWVKSNLDEFLTIIKTANDDPFLVRRFNLFVIMVEALHNTGLSQEIKLNIKSHVLKLVKTNEDFFDFVKYYTLANKKTKQKISTSLSKIIIEFYKSKTPKCFAELVAKRESYHGWTHKDLLKLCHFKCSDILCEPALKYALFGIKNLPEGIGDNEESKKIVEFLRKSHEIRTTEDPVQAAALIGELHFGVDQVNSKLNKNEEIWLAAMAEMDTKELLKHLHQFYKWGFLKANSNFQAKVIETLSDPEKVKRSNIHPVEVFIHLTFFEKGGKPMDPKLIEYLKSKETKDDVLSKLMAANEPKCKPVIQNINKCLKLSYDNVKPTGKKFMVTIDVTPRIEDGCFHNKRIKFLEAAVAVTRFLCKVERSVTVAVFKDSQINFVDISKSHTAVERLKEHKSTYIVPSAPIEWARNKKKPVDVFINFMSCNWYSGVPQEVREKMSKISDVLNKYSQKLNQPNTKVVKFFLGGPTASYTENPKNILSIAGFTVEVPRVLEAFCNGKFS